jgi:hypothetical protein
MIVTWETTTTGLLVHYSGRVVAVAVTSDGGPDEVDRRSVEEFIGLEKPYIRVTEDGATQIIRTRRLPRV